MESIRDGKRSPFKVLRTLKRRKFYLLAPIVLITIAVASYTERLPERFRARALVASESATPEPYLSTRVEQTAVMSAEEHLRTIRETLFSPPLLETVLREFKLYDVTGSQGLEEASENLKGRIQIQVDSPDTFYVGFEGSQPRQVMEVANRLATLFVERTTEVHGQHTAQVDSLLDAEVDRLHKQLTSQEEGLKHYKEGMAAALPDRVAANLKLLEDLQQQAQNKSDQIAEAQAKRVAVVDEILALENQGALEAEPRQKTATETALDDLRGKLRQLKTRYTAENPEIQRTQKEIHDLEALGTPLGTRTEPSAMHMRYLSLKADLTAIDQRIKGLQQERTSLSSQMTTYEKRINASPGLETTLAERMRDAALTRTQYESMVAKQQAEKLDRRVEKTSQRAAFKIVEPAQLPTAPYSPQRRQIMLLAFLASLGIGLAAVFLVEQLDSSFETTEDLQSFTNIPVLSAIPTVSNSLPKMRAARNGHNSLTGLETSKAKSERITPQLRRHSAKHRLTVLSDPQSIASQQYGILTLKVQRWREQTGGRVLVVTSAAGGEGKSLTALNLSLALASSLEGRVLLLDCDLRRPQVHERLGLMEPLGFSDLLSVADCDVSPFISKVGNLFVMTGGSDLSDPVGLSSRRTREILARLRDEYDFIVLDSPPIVPIADSHFLAAQADGVVMVVRARQTRRELLQRAVESLGVTNIVGVVLNDVEYADTRYAYAYRYYQRHYIRGR